MERTQLRTRLKSEAAESARSIHYERQRIEEAVSEKHREVENRLRVATQVIEEDRQIARVKLDEMSIKLEQSQNKAYAAAEDHREALMTLRNQKMKLL